MSLQWNKPAQLFIDAHQVTGCIAEPGRPLIQVVMPAKNGEEALGSNGALDRAIRDVLAELASRALRPVRKVDVEVADGLAYCDVLKADARKLSALELRRWAGLSLADSLGLDPERFTTRCFVQPDGQSLVICSISADLIDTVKNAFLDKGPRLHLLEPAFAAFWNRHYKSVKSRNALFVRSCGASLMLGWLRDGNWQSLATERLSRMDWITIRDSCDAYCRRICVPDQGSLPIFFDADIKDIPVEARGRWQRLALEAEPV